MNKDTALPAIARRLELTHTALGLSQAEFADRAGVARNTYNQWENAKGRPNLDGAMTLCVTYNLTLDWIYFGQTSGLPYQIAQKLVTAA